MKRWLEELVEPLHDCGAAAFRPIFHCDPSEHDVDMFVTESSERDSISSEEINRLVDLQRNLDEVIWTVGKNHRYVADRKVILGDCYQNLLKHEQAIAFYEDAMKIYFQTLGNSCPQVISLKMKLGKAFYMNGNFERSVECYHQGLDMMKSQRERVQQEAE